jgi:hypothetical protein
VIALTTLHGRFPAMRLAGPAVGARWGHGDGLVLRGLSELPVILSAVTWRLAAAAGAGHPALSAIWR